MNVSLKILHIRLYAFVPSLLHLSMSSKDFMFIFLKETCLCTFEKKKMKRNADYTYLYEFLAFHLTRIHFFLLFIFIILLLFPRSCLALLKPHQS